MDADPQSEFALEPMARPTEDMALGFAIGIAKWFRVCGGAPDKIEIVGDGGSIKKYEVDQLIAIDYLLPEIANAPRR
jgi:hypothetical protein